MKTKSTVKMFAIVTAIIATFVASAQEPLPAPTVSPAGTGPTPVTPSDVWALRGQDTFREYALGIVVRGYRDVQSESIVWDEDTVVSVEATGKGAEEVLDILFQADLKYRLANVNDQIHGRVWLYDASGALIFYGGSQYTANDVKRQGQRTVLPYMAVCDSDSRQRFVGGDPGNWRRWRDGESIHGER